jgi:hypothetical protein
MKLLTKPYYVYTIDDDDDEYQATVWQQDRQWESRNRVTFYAKSPVFDTLDEAIEWGEHQVRSLSK